MEFYTRSISYLFSSSRPENSDPIKCSYCFCVYSPEYKSDDFLEDEKEKQTQDKQPTVSEVLTSIEYEIRTFQSEKKPLKREKIVQGGCEQANQLREARMTLGVLYVGAMLFMIPQFFEKRIIKVEVLNNNYSFPEITEFGNSR